MAKLGMDDQAVRALAGRLDEHATAIASLVGQIEGVVSLMHVSWHGDDATSFVGWWRNQHQPALQRAHDAITGLARSARNNAADQDRVSAVTTGAPAGPPARTAPPPPAVPPPSMDGYRTAYLNHDPHLVGIYQEGQCTSWAVYRREQLGLPLPPNIPNGENGYQMAGHIGLVDPGQAGQGSLVSLTNGHNHVMVVESVGVASGSDRHAFVVSELNALRHGDGTDFSPDTTLVEHADGTWSVTNHLGGVSRTYALDGSSVQISAVR